MKVGLALHFENERCNRNKSLHFFNCALMIFKIKIFSVPIPQRINLVLKVAT